MILHKVKALGGKKAGGGGKKKHRKFSLGFLVIIVHRTKG